MKTHKLSVLSIALAAALAVAGCGGGGDGDSYQEPQPPAPPPTQPKVAESFTKWSKAVVAQPAEGQPENMDELLVDFDGNNDPAAYAELFPAEPTT
jgi:hypothetical protein